MSTPISFGKFDLHAVSSLGDPSAAPEPDEPFRIAVLGDFSGRSSRGLCEPESVAGRRLHAVDRDTFDELLAKLGTAIRLPMPGGQALELRFREIDDFLPDRIYEQVEAFAALRQLRRKLHAPQTFAEAAAEVRSWRGALAETKSVPESPPPEPPAAVPEGLFDQVLAEAEQQSSESAKQPAPSQWDRLIAELINPYLEPKRDPQQAEYVASVDAAVGELMRRILHHPHFRALEASWRALSLLVSRLECGSDLTLSVWDVSKAELEADLSGHEDLASSGIFRALVEQSVHVPEGKPWSLFVGDYCFGPTRRDAELLGRLAKIAQAAGAPLMADADSRLAGCESLARTPDPDDWQFVPDQQVLQAWTAVRAIPEAPWAGLVLPRLLLRLPHGPRTTPVEKFDFEELPGEPDHEGYLWGNAAFACACLLGQSFSRHGWSFVPGMVHDLDDLPVHVYTSDGELVMKPCAEVLLTDRGAAAILDLGLIPLRSVRNQGAVRVESFVSIAGSRATLRGRWG